LMVLLIWNLMVAPYRCKLKINYFYNKKHLFMALPWSIHAFIPGRRSDITAT